MAAWTAAVAPLVLGGSRKPTSLKGGVEVGVASRGGEWGGARMQAVPLAARRNAGAAKGSVEGPAPLLQLPHMDGKAAKRLARRRVRGLGDLQGKSPQERSQDLRDAGLDDQQVRPRGTRCGPLA